jgi:hypothetical protein
MIDLEEIDLSAAPSSTNARKIRAGKKNVAKILARARSVPSWKLSLASVRGNRWPAKRKRITLPEGAPAPAGPALQRGGAATGVNKLDEYERLKRGH